MLKTTPEHVASPQQQPPSRRVSAELFLAVGAFVLFSVLVLLRGDLAPGGLASPGTGGPPIPNAP